MVDAVDGLTEILMLYIVRRCWFQHRYSRDTPADTTVGTYGRGSRLLQVDPVVDVVGAHERFDMREVPCHGPHHAVVGPRRVQGDDRSRRPLNAHLVQHLRRVQGKGMKTVQYKV